MEVGNVLVLEDQLHPDQRQYGAGNCWCPIHPRTRVTRSLHEQDVNRSDPPDVEGEGVGQVRQEWDYKDIEQILLWVLKTEYCGYYEVRNQESALK